MVTFQLATRGTSEGREAAIATSRQRNGGKAPPRKHVSVRVVESTAESFEAVRQSRGYSRAEALEEAMRHWALGRATEEGLRASQVGERLDALAELVSGEAEQTRELQRAHRKSLGGLLNENRYGIETIYALIEAVFPRSRETSRESLRATAHRRIQEGRRRGKDDSE